MNSLILLSSLLAPGQPPAVPKRPVRAPAVTFANNIETRKAARDLVVQLIGPQAIPFTKKYGDLGVAALQKCSPETGKRLVDLFDSDELKIANPKAALEAVRKHTEPQAELIAAWLCEHHAKLESAAALACWCRAPLEFVYELKDLDQQVEQLRADRSKGAPPRAAPRSDNSTSTAGVLALLGAAAVLAAAFYWKRRRGGGGALVPTRSGSP